jgi:hypothetical protein
VRRRTIAGVLAGLTVFGAVFAMAASLGGIQSGSVGAEDAVVASCDTNGVVTSYTTAWATNQYVITEVTVTGIAHTCDNEQLSVSLTNAAGAQIGSVSITIADDLTDTDTDETIALSTDPSAELVVGIHVAIA